MRRVARRQQKVALAEAQLMVQRSVLRAQLSRFRHDAAAAATPARIITTGALLGGLVGLLQGGRRRPQAPAAAPAAAAGGSLRALIQVFRLVSMAAPLIAPLMRTASSEAVPDDGAGGGDAADAASADGVDVQ